MNVFSSYKAAVFLNLPVSFGGEPLNLGAVLVPLLRFLLGQTRKDFRAPQLSKIMLCMIL